MGKKDLGLNIEGIGTRLMQVTVGDVVGGHGVRGHFQQDQFANRGWSHGEMHAP